MVWISKTKLNDLEDQLYKLIVQHRMCESELENIKHYIRKIQYLSEAEIKKVKSKKIKSILESIIKMDVESNNE